MKLDNSTKLVLDRTCLAHDRTLMAWARTATSLITFGLGLYKIVEYARGDAPSHSRLFGPREFGLIMIVVGLLALVLGTYERSSRYGRSAIDLSRCVDPFVDAGARCADSRSGGVRPSR